MAWEKRKFWEVPCRKCYIFMSFWVVLVIALLCPLLMRPCRIIQTVLYTLLITVFFKTWNFSLTRSTVILIRKVRTIKWLSCLCLCMCEPLQQFQYQWTINYETSCLCIDHRLNIYFLIFCFHASYVYCVHVCKCYLIAVWACVNKVYSSGSQLHLIICTIFLCGSVKDNRK